MEVPDWDSGKSLEGYGGQNSQKPQITVENKTENSRNYTNNEILVLSNTPFDQTRK